MLLLSSADFLRIIFSKNSFRNTIRVSNSLDPDQDRHSVGPDLGPNSFERLSADEKKSPLARKSLILVVYNSAGPSPGYVTFFLDILAIPSSCLQILSADDIREGSGSVVECLSRDRGVACSSLTSVTALWSLSKTHLS